MDKEVRSEKGKIYFGNILSSGKMSSNNKYDITEPALEAVLDHIMHMPGYAENGYAGYEYKKTTGGTLTLCLIDNNKVQIMPISNIVSSPMISDNAEIIESETIED